MKHLIRASVLLVMTALAAFAQARPARLLVTVVDPSGAVVANATVTVTAADPASTVPVVPSARTSDQGIATFNGITLARYTISAEFQGFDVGTVSNVELRTGDNRHTIVLRLRGVRDAVTVEPDRQAQASERAGATFGFGLAPEQIEHVVRYAVAAGADRQGKLHRHAAAQLGRHRRAGP